MSNDDLITQCKQAKNADEALQLLGEWWDYLGYDSYYATAHNAMRDMVFRLASLPDGPKPFWRCEECRHEDHKKAMPTNRAAFYSRPVPPKCPKCKSESFIPVGY